MNAEMQTPAVHPVSRALLELNRLRQARCLREYVLIQNASVGRTVHRVPDNLDDETAATAEPVSVGIGAVDLAGIRPGDRVVMLGAGMISAACMQAAKAAGPKR